ncbi:aminoglycoside phosphotransferase family protein [Paractinoplanes ovalisporus]|uniref:aminoglycoside phosphotransferase family protein n=1 Tax=Paractinoplanes ovalisporus TaxID=2810368 RepID=UPI0027DC92AA|nr:aminoglycoside phosphotransferase family protein [Actinoplanes ovalisporus]
MSDVPSLDPPLTDDVPDLGPPPRRLTVDAGQVGRLVAEQFPQWAHLPVRPVADGGWDNRTFHLGDHMSVRLPSAAEYAQAVDKEHHWLPRFASRLPQPIPKPLAKGAPGPGYPFPWSVYEWLDGTPATPAAIADPVRFALDLAEFLAALRSIDPAGGPGPGKHNWFRGGTLRTFEGLLTAALERELSSVVPDCAADCDILFAADRANSFTLVREIWADALGAPWDGVPYWFHGDVAAGNLLLDAGRLSAVIDFGTCGVGDPACDLAVAWTLLTAEGRRAFRDRLGVDDATWRRGRGWALWKSLADDESHVVDVILSEA